jgi:hypothetical protein
LQKVPHDNIHYGRWKGALNFEVANFGGAGGRKTDAGEKSITVELIRRLRGWSVAKLHLSTIRLNAVRLNAHRVTGARVTSRRSDIRGATQYSGHQDIP